MSERFEVSFKNKEVRMWFYLGIPAIMITIIISFYGEQKYQYIPDYAFLIIFIIWRFFTEGRRSKKERKKSS